MDSVLQYKELRDIIPGIKKLFQTRHYIQCATMCERLLSSPNEIHPVHHAYLNFYLALSHDTMAREAGMRNRHSELQLAEMHYLAAISAITPTRPDSVEAGSSASSDDGYDLLHRRPSNADSLRSDHSVSTTATSVNSSISEAERDRAIVNKAAYPTPSKSSLEPVVNSPPGPSTHDPISTSNACQTVAQAPRELKLSADLSAFITMVKSHLASVRELKETTNATTTNRYSFSGPRYTPSNNRPPSQTSLHAESEMEQIRRQRRSLSFRPRFDPTSVRKLCADALDEL